MRSAREKKGIGSSTASSTTRPTIQVQREESSTSDEVLIIEPSGSGTRPSRSRRGRTGHSSTDSSLEEGEIVEVEGDEITSQPTVVREGSEGSSSDSEGEEDLESAYYRRKDEELAAQWVSEREWYEDNGVAFFAPSPCSSSYENLPVFSG